MNIRTPAFVKQIPVQCSISVKAQHDYDKFLNKLKDDFERKRETRIVTPETLSDFEILQTIGEKAFGRIVGFFLLHIRICI